MIRLAGFMKHGVRCQHQSICKEHQWTSSKIRKTFVDYFREKDHIFVPSSSVIPKKDDGSYFVNAGMNQFKPLFLGMVDKQSEMATYKRVANYQKCIRIGGKHNDLDDVGQDHYHHTFFEMLGNWSFNDYGKVEACKMAWELLTKVFEIPEERLFVTYFKGDAALNLMPDTACRDIWLSIGVPDHRILPFGMKDNFWTMGNTGPCGPCTEIHYCHHDNVEAGKQLVNAGNENVVEIWNLVFMEYDRCIDGVLKPLPQKHIDTGMGLERVTALLNKTNSNYNTDLFRGLFTHIQKECKINPYGNSLSDSRDRAYRVVADHSRMFTVTIGDGLLPGRKETEGKLRNIMYRSLYQLNEVLGAPQGILKTVVPVVVESLGDAYPNLSQIQNKIMDIVQETELRYLESITIGRKVMRNAMKEFGDVKVLSGEQILRIQEGKYGRTISSDVVSLLATEFNVTLDIQDFEVKLKASQANGSSNRQPLYTSINQHDINYLTGQNILTTIDRSGEVLSYCEERMCYEFPEMRGKVVALKLGDGFVSEVHHGEEGVGVILDETNFYAEGGGQVSDVGEFKDQVLGKSYGRVADVRKQGGYVFHWIEKVENDIKLGDVVCPVVDADRRTKCMANHTATHIVHYALNKVLGNVRQQGSYVSQNLLTFDFSCLRSQVTPDDLKEVANIVNEFVGGDFKVERFLAPLDEVVRAKHLFKLEDEVYPTLAKVVCISRSPKDHKDPRFYEEEGLESLELCGGTHVTSTKHIQDLVITNFEGSIQGTKRITAITRDLARQALNNGKLLKNKINEIVQLENVEDILKKIKEIDKFLCSESTISKVDREKVLEKMEKINSDISQNKNSFVVSIIAQSIKDEINKIISTSEENPIVVQVAFEKNRDAIKSLLEINYHRPIFVLSKHKPYSDSKNHSGVVYVPKDFPHFQPQEWTTHLCHHLGGNHRPPKGKFLKHGHMISVFSIPIKGNRVEESTAILKEAEEFITSKMSSTSEAIH